MSKYKYPKSIKTIMEKERDELEEEFKRDGLTAVELTLVRLCFESGFLKALSAVKEERLLK